MPDWVREGMNPYPTLDSLHPTPEPLNPSFQY